MVISVTLIARNFYPLRGGITTYLMQFYKKYLSGQRFQVIVPNIIGSASDYEHLPFEVFRTDFYPYDFKTSRRDQSNNEILALLKKTHTDIILFGHLRSHPEIGLLYKDMNPHSRFGIITYGKEVFFDDCIVGRTHNENQSHVGFLESEVDFYKNMLRKADYVFSVSKFTKNLILSQGISREVDVIYPSINIPNAPTSIKEHSDTFNLLSVGRFIDRKGQQKVIDVIPRLLKIIPSVKYSLVGYGPNQEKIMQKISDLDIADYVKIYDDADDSSVSQLYRSSDIFVLPTGHLYPNNVEGFGVVFIEASAYGLPVIGGDTGGVTEAIVNNVTGYLIDPNSESQLESKILALYENPDLRVRMGTKGRERVISEFNSVPSPYLINLFNQNWS